ncbi:hypothetical protein Tco_0746557 [Tanacetum coccineum]
MVAYLEKSEGSEGLHEIIDFISASHIHYALTASPTIYTSLIDQFWQTAALCTIDDGVLGITATIDRKVKIIISEGSIRRHLKLEDSECIPSLLTVEIFEQLALIWYVTTSDSLNFQKGNFFPQWKFFIHTILHCLSLKKTAWEQFSSNIATAIIFLATNMTFNFSKFIFDAMVKNLDSTHKFLMYPRFIQIFLNKHQRLIFPHTRTYPTSSITHKLFSNMKRVSKGYSGVITPLFDTMLIQPQGEEPSIQTTLETSPSKIASSPSLSYHHTSIIAPSTSQPPITPTEEATPMPHESPFHSVHSLGRDEGSMQQHELMDLVTKLTEKIGVLEKDLRRDRIVISKDEDAVEDSSKQGRKISDIDTDPIISLVQPQHDMDYDFDVSTVEGFTTASIPITIAGLEIISTAEDISGAETLVYIRRSASKAKDKGKAIMQESEASKKIKKRVQVQMSVNEELAKKVFEEEQARFNAEQEARLKAEQEQERFDFETAFELQRQLDKREEVVAKEAHDIDWSDPSILRYHTLYNRPFSIAEVRKNMCMYMKNQGGYKMSHFKGMSYEEIRPIFKRVWDQIQSFVSMDSEKEKDSEKKTKGRLKRAGQYVVEEHAKTQKTTEASESVQEQPSEEPKADELSQE